MPDVEKRVTNARDTQSKRLGQLAAAEASKGRKQVAKALWYIAPGVRKLFIIEYDVPPCPSDSASFNCTLLATPGPLLLTTMVNTAGVPAVIVALAFGASGVFTTVIFGGWQSMLP